MAVIWKADPGRQDRLWKRKEASLGRDQRKTFPGSQVPAPSAAPSSRHQVEGGGLDPQAVDRGRVA